MKTRYINIILAISVMTALYLFYLNTRKPTDIDRLAHSMAAMKKYVNPRATIGLMTISRDLELETKLQYVLATIPADYGLKDTTLFLLPVRTTDATISSMLRNRTIIVDWNDSQYHYMLTRTP